MASIIRRFGPILGEGVVVEERAGPPTVQPGLFGVTAWEGILEKGPTDELIEIISDKALARKTGGVISGTQLPDAGIDFWSASRGAGSMFLIRVTDGTGRKSTLTHKSRETDLASPLGLGRWRDVLKWDALSVGRWAGAYNRRIAEFPTSAAVDLTETTLNTGLTLKLNEFKGGSLTLAEVATKSYKIVSNDIAGVVTVTSDSMMSTDYDAGTDLEFTLFKSNTNDEGIVKNFAVLIKDGVRDPATEFGAEMYQNGFQTRNYEDASMDPNSDVYIVPLVNDDAGNHEVFVTDLFVLTGGEVIAPIRPANQFGTIPIGLAATVMPIEPVQFTVPAGNTGDGIVGTFVVGATVQKDRLTLTVTDDTLPGSEVWSVVSAQQDKTFPDATTAVVFPAENAWTIGFTITAGVAAWVNGDQIFIDVEPLIVGEAVGGRLYFDVDGDPLAFREIVANDRTTVTVRPQHDLTALTAVDNHYRLQFREGLVKGYDGHDGVVDADHRAVWDPTDSLFNRLRGKNLGLIKFAAPGVTATAIQQDGKDYAEIYGGEFRYELPTSSVTTEDQAISFVQDTLGKSDLAVVTFPSFYNKAREFAAGTKEITATGLIMGIEARKAVEEQGYHKQALGEAAVLPDIVSLPTGDAELDRERLGPAGIQSIRKIGANFVHWGNTVPRLNTGSSAKKNKREQLSHYINVLRENFGFIIFALNEPDTREDAQTALVNFFLPEWRPKKALRGDRFLGAGNAVQIKLDSSNNTQATEVAGDLVAEITLRIVDLVERFKISIGEAGIFESLVA